MFAKEGHNPINLILLRWYDVWLPEGDEYEDNEQELYGCLCLWLTNQYTCIYLDLVDTSIHIVKRNSKENEYLVNKYIFWS